MLYPAHVSQSLFVTDADSKAAPDKRWLLVFDNIENSSLLRTHWSLSATHGEAIFTTQNRSIANDPSIVSHLHLKAMTPAQGATFLLVGIKEGESQREVAEQISMSVSGLPLALALIVGFLQGMDDECELSEFQDEFLAKQTNFTLWASGEGTSISQYSKNLLTVFSMAVGKLPPDSRHLIDIMSILSPDAVQESMLTRSHLSEWPRQVAIFPL